MVLKTILLEFLNVVLEFFTNALGVIFSFKNLTMMIKSINRLAILNVTRCLKVALYGVDETLYLRVRLMDLLMGRMMCR